MELRLRMRVLGIDFGEKRVGLALSDPMGWTAQGLSTLEPKSMNELLDKLAEVIAEREVTELVVGLPQNMNGSLGPKAEEAKRFANRLSERFGLPVHLVDERLTTVQAEREMLRADMSRKKRRKRIDRMAAQFILQRFLDSRAQS